MTKHLKEESKLIVHRGYIAKLLGYPKSLRDQLILELPCLAAFRTGEISSFLREYIDFENGDLKVLDSKSLQICTVPLDPTLAKHLDEYIQETNRHSGAMIQGRKRTGRGLEPSQLEVIWAKYCRIVDIPVLTPRHGRAYFACKWHFIERKSIYGLMMILRHDKIESTEHYLARLCDYLTVKAEFNDGLASPFVDVCSRFSQCPVAAPKCRCRFFTAQTPQMERLPVSERLG